MLIACCSSRHPSVPRDERMSYDVLNYAEAVDARNESCRCRWWTFPKQRSCEKHWLFIPAEKRGKSATIPATRRLPTFSNQREQFSSDFGIDCARLSNS